MRQDAWGVSEASIGGDESVGPTGFEVCGDIHGKSFTPASAQ